ncbi:MAG: hypothetical protein Aurels2KO_25130 [Aureliella sp.]
MRKPPGHGRTNAKALQGQGSGLRFATETQNTPKNRTADTPTTLLIIFLACLATVLCYQVFLKKFDSGIRGAVYKELREILPNARVTIGDIASNGPGEIALSDVHIFPRSSPRKEVFSAHRVVLRGNLDIAAWAKRTTKVKKVELHGVQVNVWPTEQGGWSVDDVKPCSKPNTIPPAIVFHDARLQIARSASTNALPIIWEINGEIKHQVAASRANASLGAANDLSTVTITGKSSGIADKLYITGNLNRVTGAWNCNGNFHRLHFSSSVLGRLPEQASRYAAQVAGLDCVLSGEFVGGGAKGKLPDFVLAGDILEGRLQDDRLPYPLDDLQGTYHCTNKTLQLRDLRASNGKTQLVVDADITGFTPNSPITIVTQAANLELDSRLYGSLPEKLQIQWDKIGLAGSVSGTIQLFYNGQKWTPVADLQCSGATVSPWLFPYPLTDIYGPVSYRGETFSSPGLRGMAGGQPISGKFSLSKSGSQWFGRIEGGSAGPVAIDEQLISALTPRDASAQAPAETFVRSLSPTGSIELRSFSLTRLTAGQTRWHRELDAHIYDARIVYDNFRYPIYDIRGRIHCTGTSWSLDKFEGRNDSGRIACSGSWQQVESGNLPFRLNFDALGIPLEEELLGALPSDAQHIWRELQPDGSLDHVKIELRRGVNDTAVKTEVHITETADSNSVAGRSLRIHPRGFPYMLSDVACRIKYTPGRVEIYKASGKNRSSEIALLGQCLPLKDGRWQANVQWLPQTRLIVDQELLTALPESIRQSLVKIDFRGPISIIGTSEIAFPNNEFLKPVTHWNCQLDLENAQLGSGDTIGNLRGTVFMNGTSDGERVRSSGRVAMDALTVLDVPVFGLQGPFELFDSTLYFGQAVNEALPPVSAKTDTRMHAKALAGDFSISGTGELTSGKFEFTSQLKDAELSSLLQDVGVDKASTKANCDAVARFSGIPWNPQGWSGDGSIHLSDAQLFQLPFMIRFLRAASVSARDDSAFQTADIGFQIDGERINLNEIDCTGDLLRLRGSGHTNLRREIDLQLYTYVGRRISLASVMGPLAPDSRFATTLMMINVDGTLDDPQMQRRQFPQFASIQELFPELEP